jgi:hypothetical protein
MSCGPTPDWDHNFGCERGFGGFGGLAFVSCAGPFEVRYRKLAASAGFGVAIDA